MKKLYVIILLFITLESIGQSTVGQNTLPQNGNVGIGTTNPDSPLQIHSNISSIMRFQRPNANIFGFEISGNLFGLYDYSNSVFRWRATGNNLILNESNGNVGIGTTNPSRLLEVNGESRMQSLNLTVNGANSWTLGTTSSKYFLYNNTTTNEVFSILNNGNIGIGTTSPSAKLDVNGWTRLRAGLEMPTNTDFIWNAYYSGGWKYRTNGFAGGFYQDGSGNLAFNVAPIGVADGALTFQRAFTILNNGNLGFGTTNAQEVIDLGNGTGGRSIAWGGNGTNYYTSIGSGYSSAALLLGHGLKPRKDGVGWQYSYNGAIDLAGIEVGDGSGNINFYNEVSSSGRTVGANFTKLPSMTINGIGNVGIGTTNPQKRLDVVVPSNDFASVGVGSFGVGAFTGIHFGYREDNNFYRKSAIIFERTDLTENNAQGKVHILNGPQSGAANATLADAKLTIGESGNVGIGTTNPGYKLQVEGKTRFQDAIYVKNGALIGYVGPKSDWTGSSTINNDLAIGSYNQNLSFFTNNDVVERMKITSSGQVVIGSVSTLPTDYKLAVAGNIIAEKVKVKKSNTWPDFVFSPSYKLPNLTDVESFIKQNSHLPEIPSAKEVETEGQDLGEMNRLLLKKVEELTLYLIEQNKEIKTLKNKVELLEKK